MKKLNLKKVPKKLPTNPIFDGLPDRLKSVEMYYKVEKELFNLLQTDHKHKTVKEYVSCMWCQKKRELRQNRIKALGFKNIEQYMQWKKIMDIIISNKLNVK